MKKRQGNIVISVEDKGVGMNPSSRTSVKPGMAVFGLFSIRERLSFMGGRVEIFSKPGRGTCVTLIVPMEKLKRVSERR